MLRPARTRAGQRWLDAPLRYKGSTVVAAFALVLVPPIAVGAIVNARLDDARTEAQVTTDEIAELGVLQDSLRDAVTAMQEYLTLGLADMTLIERYRGAAARIPTELAAFVDGLPHELTPRADAVAESTGLLLDDLAALSRFGAAGPEVADVSDDPAFFALNPVLVDAVLQTLDSTDTATGEVDGIETDLGALLDEQRAEVDRLQRLSVSATVASLVVALAVAIATIYAVTNGLARRVKGLADNAQRFLRGDPLRPTTASKDEIGQVAVTMYSAGELLNRRRDEAVAATRAKDGFLARVSHELKTPLTAMIGFAQLLAEDPDLAPGSRADAGRIVTAGRHLHGLIEELLDVSAIEAGRLALDIGPVPLRPAVADALALSRRRAGDRSPTISSDVPADLVVTADPARLREVLHHLLADAVQHGGESGHVDLAATHRGDSVRITVTHPSAGGSPDLAELRSVRPERLDAADPDVGGTGMRLMLTRQVVAAMGGEIGAEGAHHRRSTVWVSLPVVGQDATGSGSGTGSPPGAGPRRAAEPPIRARARARLVPAVSRAHLRRRWLDAPLRHKLLSLVVLMALVWTPPIVIGVVLSAQLDDARAEAAATTRALEEIDALQDSVLRSTSAVQSYLTLGLDDAAFVDDYRVPSAAVPEQLAAVSDGLPDDVAGPAGELEAAVNALLDSLESIVDYGAPYRETADPDDVVRFAIDDALEAEVVDLVAATARSDDAIADLGDRLRARLASERDQVDDLQTSMVRATVVSMVAALLVGTTGAYVVMTGLVRRIAALSDNVDRLLRSEPLRPPPASADEIGQLTDVTLHVGELLAQRRALAESATRAKDQLLSRVSQELETPLTTMIALARRLGENPGLTPRSRDDARHIVKAGQQLHGLIAEMLDIKAIEAGLLALTIEPVPVDVVARETISLLRPAADERAITIESDCPTDLTVAADRRRLREVLLNLLSNAVKYNRPGGRIEIAASRLDTSVRVSVRDTGRGISAADQGRLFEPFERLDAGGTDVEGSGMGLALSKRVVHAMHGTIGVESTVGRGSTFWFDLPAAGGAAPVSSASGPVAHDR